jgi:hypothetical protein
MAESDRMCATHDEPILWEPGGHDKATIHGRWHCRSCDAAFMEALDR